MTEAPSTFDPPSPRDRSIFVLGHTNGAPRCGQCASPIRVVQIRNYEFARLTKEQSDTGLAEISFCPLHGLDYPLPIKNSTRVVPP